ncbi:uncharacterized protein PFL1_04721 [Pseudozyma flocculosa PF-1]|uniref:EF-hand domain-containing protein n=2 Tax=Pseudozyma flocculosa TaxID=84751 RepID=A0A5C3F599_9BASI|nr:uncharacterized protein PFL1_04721 [Pseudozyma flocculosa PF-1]EPQ27583.1 hypothetical protein PFL1_04721 [Pseudozyma flocculosa PF-1]SPO39290.1 uncharacterized protein PSFLO_04770 [Pseudozyma flocculosa]
MTSLPYRAKDGDPAEIPLDSLSPSRHVPLDRERNASQASSLGGPPPPHHVHAHDFNDDHYFAGLDPGNQAAYVDTAHSQQHNPADTSSASGSGSSQHQQHQQQQSGWGQYDTVVDRSRDEKSGLHFSEGTRGDAFQPPQAPFSQRDNYGGHSRASSIASTADDSDDFDWDTSSDEDEERDKGDSSGKIVRARRGRKLYLACLRLARPVRLFLIGLIGTAILLTPFIVMLTTYKGNPARGQVEVWSIWLAIIWAAACGTFLVIDWVPALLMRIVIAVYGKAPEVSKTYIEAFMATTLYLKLVLCVAWAWISLGGVVAIEFNGSDRPPYFKYVFLVLRALFASTIILLAEKLGLQIIAIGFHKTAVKDRLVSNQMALRALDKLHESKYLQSRPNKRATASAWQSTFNMRSRPGTPAGMPSGGPHSRKASRDNLGGYFAPANQADDGVDGHEKSQHHSHHHHHHRHPSSHLASNGANTADGSPLTDHEKRRRERKANFGTQISDAIANATMKGGKLYKGPSYGSQRSARKLAKLLFTNLSDHKSTLVAEDFIPYFKTEEEAREAFALFDADKNGDISKEEMREAVQRIYRERKALSTSLKDMSSAISKLDNVLMFIGFIIVVFIWLLIFNGDSTVDNIVPLSTFVVGFSFVFGNSAKNIFESMIFIFATHPYDVGDLVCIDDEWMFVKEFGLLSTVFRTTTNQEIIAPNALLASSKYIYNSRRSGAQWEVLKIQCAFDTSLQTLDTLRTRLRAWTKENDREFGGPLDLNFNEISQQNAVELVVAFEHKGNWQDWGARWARRTKMMRFLKTTCEELGIRYELPPQPIAFEPRSGPAPFRLGSARRTPAMSRV